MLRFQSLHHNKFHPYPPGVKRGWLRKFHLSRICRFIKRIIKRSGTARAISSTIKIGQKDTEARIRLRLHGAIYRPDSFVLMLRYCANLKEIRYESTSLNRIVADKSHRVIAA